MSRDPKAHAKHLAERWQSIRRQVVGAKGRRRTRHLKLLSHVGRARRSHADQTGWFYDADSRTWRHVEIIPDTEEGTS